MTLKEIFAKYVPADKIAEVEQALGGNYDYVPRTRLNEVIGERDTARRELDEHKAKSAKYDESQAEITKLKQQLVDKDKEWEGKLKKQERDAKIDSAIRAAKAKNPATVLPLLDATKFGDDLKGLDDEIKRVQKSDPYLFGPDGSRGTGGSGGNKEKPGDGTDKTTAMDALKSALYGSE
jgi:hypothetical protein